MPEDNADQTLDELKKLLGANSNSAAVISAVKIGYESNQLSIDVLKNLDSKQRWTLMFAMFDEINKKMVNKELDTLDEYTALFQKIMKIDPSLLSQMDYYGRFPLIYAINNANLDLVKLLIHCGANPNQTFHLHTPMAYALRPAIQQRNPGFSSQLDTIKELNESNKNKPEDHSQAYLLHLGKS